MIHNVCIHVSNEQPLLADLYDLPSASDAGLVCTNVRSMDGKRPIFIDSSAATFFFPYHVIRFLEIPEGAFQPNRTRGGQAGAIPLARPTGEPDTVAESLLPVVVGVRSDQPGPGDPEAELEIDEDFLQRIRDI